MTESRHVLNLQVVARTRQYGRPEVFHLFGV